MSRNVETAAPDIQLISVPQVVANFGVYTNVEGTLEGFPLWSPPATRNSLVRVSLYVGCATRDVAPQGVTIRAEAADPFGNQGKIEATTFAPSGQSGAVGVMWVAAGTPIRLTVEQPAGGVLASLYSYGAVVEELTQQ